MRRRHPYTFSAAIIAVLLTVAGHPATAEAASYKYANNRYVDDYTTVSSAFATVAGGKVQLGSTAPSGTKVVIQTYHPSQGILYAATGAPSVSFTHNAVGSMKSRCYWYYSFGPLSGTIPLNCWRYA